VWINTAQTVTGTIMGHGGVHGRRNNKARHGGGSIGRTLFSMGGCMLYEMICKDPPQGRLRAAERSAWGAMSASNQIVLTAMNRAHGGSIPGQPTDMKIAPRCLVRAGCPPRASFCQRPPTTTIGRGCTCHIRSRRCRRKSPCGQEASPSHVARGVPGDRAAIFFLRRGDISRQRHPVTTVDNKERTTPEPATKPNPANPSEAKKNRRPAR
jgi:hypothetical protein